MTYDPDAKTLGVLIYDRDGWRETVEGYRLSEELFIERGDETHTWMGLCRRPEIGRRARS